MQADLLATNSSEQSTDQSDGVRTPYFYTPGLKGLVQQIVHLAFFGDGLAVVSGEPGSGKTALANELVGHFDQAHDVVSIHFDADLELAECIERLCESLHIQKNQDLSVGEMLADLRHYIQALVQDDKQIIVIVDGAHHLDDQALGALVSLVQGKPESNCGMHIIFLSEPGLEQRIDSLQVLDIAVYDFQMPKFSPSELGSFLAAESPLGAKLEFSQVQKLWVESMGLPGRALGRLRKTDSDPAAMTRVSLPFGHIAAVSLLAAVLLLSFWIYDGDEVKTPSFATGLGGAGLSTTETTTKTIEIPDLDAESVPAQGSVVQSDERLKISESEQRRDEEYTAADQPVLGAEEPAIEVAGKVEDAKAQQPAESEEVPLSQNRRDLVADREAQAATGMIDRSGAAADVAAEQSQAVVQAPKPSLTPLITSSSQPVSTKKPALATPSEQSASALDTWEDFLMRQKADAYTLQVIAASNNVSLEGYLARQANRASLRMYRGTREGKSWFVVVQGVYPSRDAALAAIKTLPKEQAKAGPWPRKFASIQEEIESFRRVSR